MSKPRPVAVVGLPRPEEIISAADEEIIEADLRLAELEAAVEAGDDTVELEHVEAARKQSAWARLRRKGAEAKAERAAAARAEATYGRLVDNVIPRAVVDHAVRERELLEQARGVLEELIELNHDRNVAIAAVTRYAADPSTFRRDEDGLIDRAIDSRLGGSAFEWRGDLYAFRAPSDIVVALLRPLKSRIRERSGDIAPSWLAEL